jgi:hypothetical protein
MRARCHCPAIPITTADLHAHKEQQLGCINSIISIKPTCMPQSGKAANTPLTTCTASPPGDCRNQYVSGFISHYQPAPYACILSQGVLSQPNGSLPATTDCKPYRPIYCAAFNRHTALNEWHAVCWPSQQLLLELPAAAPTAEYTNSDAQITAAHTAKAHCRTTRGYSCCSQPCTQH